MERRGHLHAQAALPLLEKSPPSEFDLDPWEKGHRPILDVLEKESLLASLNIKPRFHGRPSVGWSLHSLS